MEREFEHRLTEVEERSKSNTHRLDEMERRQDNLDDLVTTVKVLADREERVEDDVKEIKNDVKSIKDKPGKRWDAIVDKIVWAVLAAIIAFVLGRVGL
jgi:hypothetical protein